MRWHAFRFPEAVLKEQSGSMKRRRCNQMKGVF